MLTPEQQAAVERWGQDVCVTAGPGSGKTTVLTGRYAWLVEQKQFPPERILAITFTEKAAAELKQRLLKRLGPQVDRAPVATIHGFCARLLRRYALGAGLDPGFTILDERAAWVDLKRALRAELDAWAAQRPGALRALLTAWNTLDPVEELADLYDAWRSSGGSLADLRRGEIPAAPTGELAIEAVLEQAARKLTPGLAAKIEQFREWAGAWRDPREDRLAVLARFDFPLSGLGGHPVSAAVKQLREQVKQREILEISRRYPAERRSLIEAFAAAVERYQRGKRMRGLVDFADLEAQVIELLERREAIRERVRDEFDAILIDELQDTNPQQWRLLDLLRRPGRFFAVGDINQSIFGFRHADPEGFRRFRADLEKAGGVIDRLTGNFRSRVEIINAVLGIAETLDGVEPPGLAARKEFAPAAGNVVEGFAAPDDEPRWVARRIRQLVDGEGWRYEQIALLFRATTELNAFELALREAGIPFVMARGRGFFERREVRDLENWLRVLANPRDELALFAALRSPLGRFEDGQILKLRAQADNLADALPEAFRNELDAARALRNQIAPDRLLARALDRSGYGEGLTPLARANIDKFLTLVREWWEEEPRPLPELIEYLEDVRAFAQEPNAPARELGGAVTVLTVHQAKGLEWPVVFVCDAARGTPAVNQSLLFDPEVGLGVQWRWPDSNSALGDARHQQAAELRKQREAAESERLLYVALTRAEQRLIVTAPDAARGWAGKAFRVIEPARREGAPPPVDPAPEPVAAGSPQLAFRFDEPEEEGIQWVEPLLARSAGRESLTVTSLIPARGPLELEAEGEDEDHHMPVGRELHALLAGWITKGSPEAEYLAARFQESALGHRASQAKRVEREFDFLFECEGVMVSGQIDLWFEESGGQLVLVDYKTGEEEGWERYVPQVETYALALERLTGQLPGECYLYFARSGRAIAVPVNSSRARDRIRSAASAGEPSAPRRQAAGS